jgi:hypothetical protein
MVGWVVFILGVLIAFVAAYKQLGIMYLVPVAIAWHTLLMRSRKKKVKNS